LNKNELRDQDINYKILLNALFDNLPQVFWLASVKGGNKIEYLSPAFESITGIKREEVYKNYLLWFKIIHEDNRINMMAKAERLVGEKKNTR